MTLPNDYKNTPNKIRKMWNESETQKIQIDFQKADQTFVIRELGKTVLSNSLNKKFTDISTSWTPLDVTESSEFSEFPSQQAIKAWEVTLSGLKFEEAIALRSNFQLKFGSSDDLLNNNLLEDTTFWTADYILVSSTVDGRDNTFTYFFGVLLSDNQGLEEVDIQGLQVRLNLILSNPNSFM